jgi:hypothetical protein
LFKLPTAVTFWILLEMGGLSGHPINCLAKQNVQQMILHACRRRPGLTRQVMMLHRPLPTARATNRHKLTQPVARQGTASRVRRTSRRMAPEFVCATQSDD